MTHFRAKIQTTTKSPETLAKQGIPGQNKEKQNYDKNTRNACGDSFYLPRQDFLFRMKSLKSS